MKNIFKDKKILITGGAGSLGKALVKRLLEYKPNVIRILDIDETELFDMENSFEGKRFRFLLGDVRDKERLLRALEDIDMVFHLAALKHVASCEYNPFEAVKTNIFGMQNLIEAVLDNDVERVIYTSSDKATNPNNTMGATKLLGERLMTAANYYKGKRKTIFASVRFGNVMGTNGSIIPLWRHQMKAGRSVTVTDKRMTRFIMLESEAINLILNATEMARGGELFILKMPVIRIDDMADVVLEMDGRKKKKYIGMKPGETYYEELMTEQEAERALETKDMLIIPSQVENIRRNAYAGARPVSKKSYNSKSEKVVSKDEIKIMLKKENLL